jgi:hypothetical protein
MEKCRKGDVPAFDVAGEGHTVKCWLLDGTQESAEKLIEVGP